MKGIALRAKIPLFMERLVQSALILMLLTIAGCVTVGPDHVTPKVTTPEKWSAELSGGETPEPINARALADWWSMLDDHLLTRLIERAVEGNLDLREARSRVREARARRGISKAALFPFVDATGSASKRRSSEDAGGGFERDLYTVGFDASWELDLFGGIRRSVEAAEAELEATQEEMYGILVSLLAEVALNYVDLRTFQTRLSIAEATRDAQIETYDITQWRFQAGLTTQLDVEQAGYNLEQTKAQIPALRSGLAQTINRLEVLLGENPGSLKEELADRKAVPVTPLEVAVGVPAEVLRRIPDIRRAERQLAAQTAKVGVATADLYPKFTLFGSIGLESLSFDNLFLYSSRTYGLGPSFSWTIFDAGSIRQNIEVQTALQEQALIQYEKAVLTALEDVENALVAYAEEQVRRQFLIDGVQAAQRAVDLAESQYTSGLIDFQVVLVAQRALFSLQEQQAVSAGDVTSSLISLYKALGGGWTPMVYEEEK